MSPVLQNLVDHAEGSETNPDKLEASLGGKDGVEMAQLGSVAANVDLGILATLAPALQDKVNIALDSTTSNQSQLQSDLGGKDGVQLAILGALMAQEAGGGGITTLSDINVAYVRTGATGGTVGDVADPFPTIDDAYAAGGRIFDLDTGAHNLTLTSAAVAIADALFFRGAGPTTTVTITVTGAAGETTYPPVVGESITFGNGSPFVINSDHSCSIVFNVSAGEGGAYDDGTEGEGNGATGGSIVGDLHVRNAIVSTATFSFGGGGSASAGGGNQGAPGTVSFNDFSVFNCQVTDNTTPTIITNKLDSVVNGAFSPAVPFSLLTGAPDDNAALLLQIQKLPFVVAIKNVTLRTTGAPADIGSVVLPAWLTRFIAAPDSSPNQNWCWNWVIKETGATTTIGNAGTFGVFTGPNGSGDIVTFDDYISFPTTAGGKIPLYPQYPAFLHSGVSTLYLHQTGNSTVASTISMYLVLIPFL